MFSTTTLWPGGARMRSAMIRAVVSVDPPGGKGDTSVTGRVGNVCACVYAHAIASATAIAKLLIPTSARMHAGCAADADRFLPQAQVPQAPGHANTWTDDVACR